MLVGAIRQGEANQQVQQPGFSFFANVQRLWNRCLVMDGQRCGNGMTPGHCLALRFLFDSSVCDWTGCPRSLAPIADSTLSWPSRKDSAEGLRRIVQRLDRVLAAEPMRGILGGLPRCSRLLRSCCVGPVVSGACCRRFAKAVRPLADGRSTGRDVHFPGRRVHHGVPPLCRVIDISPWRRPGSRPAVPAVSDGLPGEHAGAFWAACLPDPERSRVRGMWGRSPRLIRSLPGRDWCR